MTFMFEFSQIGLRLGGPSGISELMDDLGQALAHGGSEIKMLGGGQPAHIPAIDARWRERMEEILRTEGEMERCLGNYDPPRGNPAFQRRG